MCSILTQLKKIAENEGIAIGALEKKLGASKGVLSRAINNGTDIQSKWLSAVVENYPPYNPSWIITGKGNMLNDKQHTAVAVASKEGIPSSPSVLWLEL